MNFILAVNQEGKHTLYLNRSNTPKEVLKNESISELEVSTEKPQLMAFIQMMLDQIDQRAKPEVNEERVIQSAPAPDPVIEKILENTEFRRLAEEHWPNQPLGWRIDMAMLAMEDARNIINPKLYQRISDAKAASQELEGPSDPEPGEDPET